MPATPDSSHPAFRVPYSRSAWAAIALLTVLILLAGCSGTSEKGRSSDAGDAPSRVTNCGHTVAFDSPPERIVVLRNEVIPVLDSLGVLDRVVGLVGRFPEEYFTPAVREKLAEIPVLSEKISSVGGGEVSIEEVIAQRPDLVIGTSETVTREALVARGITVLENEESCPGSQATNTFADVDTLYRLYGDVFDREDEAERALRATRRDLKSVEAAVSSGKKRTAAMLYPTIGGGAVYAYGKDSINHRILAKAGFTNVFADLTDRNSEVSAEEILARDPDVLIVLHSDEDPAEVTSAITSLPGARTLTAVQNKDVYPLLFGFSSPASPLTVEGLRRIAERFGS